MTRFAIDVHRDCGSIRLPAASRERWQPIRGGLLNLYLYDYEEFRYEQGHLILRGNNGTGKSRIMALQLPFLFDGRLSSNRVEPDADPSKRMEWNLLMGRHNERLGYTWIEFGRCLPLGGTKLQGSKNNGANGRANDSRSSQQFLTLGCGLSASKGVGMRDPWFFITDQRVGDELFLQTEAGHALSKSGLVEAIGDHGTVYATSKEYRQAVDQALFGLGKQRYEAMVDLLLQLRKPQLSRHLDESTLARVLGEALPPPSEQMIADVAESFRGLESDRMELNRFRSACDGVDRFLKTYRRYARIAARRRAADVRQSHNKYESANRELRKAERENASACAELENAAEELRSLEIQNSRFESRIETLRADPKMRSAEAIHQASEHEKQTRDDLDMAEREVDTASRRLEQRRESQNEAFRRAEVQLKQTLDVYQRAKNRAADCGLKTQHESAFSGLELQLEEADASASDSLLSARRQLDSLLKMRSKASEQLKKKNENLATAERELAQAKSNRDDAQGRVNEATSRQRAAEVRRTRAVDDFLDSYLMWRRDSEELILPSDEEIAADIDNWSQQTDEINPVAMVVRQAELNACHTLNDERTRLQGQAEALAVEQSDAVRLIEDLERGFEAPPPLPLHADQTARTERRGAPFWLLVDFAESCPKNERANIEAALEAAGILNAWVMPDGTVLKSDFADVMLTAEPLPNVATSSSLAGRLRPEISRSGPSSDVSDDVITGVLRKIGFGEQNASTWISPDGRWRNGPLHGQCRKESAQYIGREAREEQRFCHLAAVRVELERIQEKSRQFDGQLQSINARLAAVSKQVETVPADSEIRAAASAVITSNQSALECRSSLTDAERLVEHCRTITEQARKQRDVDARDMGLSDWVDRLDELMWNLVDYGNLLAEFWPSIGHFESLKSQYAATLTSTLEAERDIQLCNDRQLDKKIRHAKAKQRLTTLEETIGAEAAEIQRELAAVEDLRRDLQGEVRKARIKETEAAQALARTEERINSRRSTIETEAELRQDSCFAFQRLCTLGLLETATAEQREDKASDWSISRSVEIARQTESTFSHINADDAAWDRVQQAVTMTIQELNSSLSQHAFTSTLTTDDGLYRVSVPYQGHDRSVHELRNLLSEEVDQRQSILDEREREIIENHLIGEVAAKLHEQIHQAHRLVDQMNVEIQKRPMSTGMMLKFDWKADDELSSGIVEMCKKLLAATGTWSPSERTAIGRYLQDHIKDVRASRETGTWQEHLAEALDYRRWHRFWVMRKQEAGWKRLTKRTHGTGSGGEKAVALTIPQFAAAAAHYSSARDDAPRLILLDEGFVGIDPDMRGKCMELINVFDLDFLLTSESEWGCYAGLPGVAIYQLSTRSGIDAVFLTRWIWNGKRRLRDETALPPAARSNRDDMGLQ